MRTKLFNLFLYTYFADARYILQYRDPLVIKNQTLEILPFTPEPVTDATYLRPVSKAASTSQTAPAPATRSRPQSHRVNRKAAGQPLAQADDAGQEDYETFLGDFDTVEVLNLFTGF